jgi:hypothetical protein
VALEIAMATIRYSKTYIKVERAHAGDVHDAPIRTHKTVMQAVESRLAYIHRFKGKHALTEEERVAERLVYSKRPTEAPTASTKEDKRREASP